MIDAICWSDERGRKRWQPVIGEKRLWHCIYGGTIWLEAGERHPAEEPKLYRSFRAALQSAADDLVAQRARDHKKLTEGCP